MPTSTLTDSGRTSSVGSLTPYFRQRLVHLWHGWKWLLVSFFAIWTTVLGYVASECYGPVQQQTTLQVFILATISGIAYVGSGYAISRHITHGLLHDLVQGAPLISTLEKWEYPFYWLFRDLRLMIPAVFFSIPLLFTAFVAHLLAPSHCNTPVNNWNSEISSTNFSRFPNDARSVVRQPIFFTSYGDFEMEDTGLVLGSRDIWTYSKSGSPLYTSCHDLSANLVFTESCVLTDEEWDATSQDCPDGFWEVITSSLQLIEDPQTPTYSKWFNVSFNPRSLDKTPTFSTATAWVVDNETSLFQTVVLAGKTPLSDAKLNLTTKVPLQDCTSQQSADTWRCRGWGAARCTTIEYPASVKINIPPSLLDDLHKLQEHTLWKYSLREHDQHHPFPSAFSDYAGLSVLEQECIYPRDMNVVEDFAFSALEHSFDGQIECNGSFEIYSGMHLDFMTFNGPSVLELYNKDAGLTPIQDPSSNLSEIILAWIKDHSTITTSASVRRSYYLSALRLGWRWILPPCTLAVLIIIILLSEDTSSASLVRGSSVETYLSGIHDETGSWQIDQNKLTKHSSVSNGRSRTMDHENTLFPYSTPAKRIWRSMKRHWRPRLETGYQRLEWHCDCGAPLYGDFREDRPGEVDRLGAMLQAIRYDGAADESLDAEDGDANKQNASPHVTTTSTSQSIGSSEATGSSTDRSVSPSDGSNVDSSATGVPAISTSLNSIVKKYIGLCINTGEYHKTIGEIDISQTRTDRETFHKIKETYQNIRGFRAKTIRWLLIKPVDIKFIQFSVEDSHRVDIIPNPPDCTLCASEADIRTRGYEPHLTPQTHPPISADAFFHYWQCYSAERSLQRAKLLGRLPKKLNKKLQDMRRESLADEDVLGWGIHIIEGLNTTLVTVLTLVVIVLSGVVSVAFSVWKHDVSGGFAVGAYIVALWLAFITALYFQWKK